ncbi:MAG: hypothetical protein K0U74_12610 [Alphaproteobacteria bacterium]|nr:hypothetical protein [Alphaproteobacteria bacterium]
MFVTGRRTLSEIEKSIADLRTQEQQMLHEMEQLTGHQSKLIGQRTSAFRELAEVRTRSAIADGVIDQADALQHKVASILEARQKTIEALKVRQTETFARRDELNGDAERIRAEIDALEERLDEAASKARDELSGEAAYVALKTAQTDARNTHDKAVAKAKQAEQDRATKGKAFESDPLFMYLWQRKYGSRDYRPHWLIRSGDDWVARMIGYSDARANYTILNEIPDRLGDHVELLADRLKQAASQVEAAEAARINKLAGTDLTGELTGARNRQAETNKALEAAEAEIEEITLQLNRYAEGLDYSFKEAVALSAEFLQHEHYTRLIAQARSTAEPTDDRIVSRIGEIDRKAVDLERTVKQRRKDLDKISRKRKELLDVAAKYRRNYYDDPSSIFEPDDIAGTVLRELIRGAITGADYWARSQRRHNWKGRPADPFRRRAGFPPFGGGWGRGGGGKKGGGFHTGGGF